MLRGKSLSLLRSHARRSLRGAPVSATPSSSSTSASTQRRPFSSSAPGSSPSPSPSEKPHWSGINTYYVSMRGLGIASRVVSSMPDFFRFYEGDVFAKHVNDDARSAMFVLTQFPNATRVDLLEFRDAAEQLVHTVYEQMYAAAGSSNGSTPTTTDTSTISGQSSGDAQDAQQRVQSIEDPLWYLSSITSDDRCAEILKHKAALQAKRLTPGNNARTPSKCVILEQLSVNRVAIAAIDYKSVRYSDEELEKRGYEEEEWLEIQVQYDVIEHLQLTSVSGNGIDDRKTVNTTFTWTFESNVTLPDQVEWQIVDATPFTEKSALLTSVKAAEKSEEEKE